MVLLGPASDGISGNGSTRPSSSSSSDSDSDGLGSKERQRLRTGLNLSLSLSPLSRILPPRDTVNGAARLFACCAAAIDSCAITWATRSAATSTLGERVAGRHFPGEEEEEDEEYGTSRVSLVALYLHSERTLAHGHSSWAGIRANLLGERGGVEKGVARPSTAGEHLTRHPMSLQGEEEEEEERGDGPRTRYQIPAN
ncbi:hypothetical protein CISG_01753 [Coccidioides immitis RMSCC 3703]|uniref:Uncharacterized protein n=2 Tax=Coccidioides immitis TaxID=5501 RepID=A0A0J8R4T7_COCIT|nr:hypothetical protein CIRG_08404 [Coccidioides immitis RMSCC 2394]KMU78713.1 hypothetical protein CISG_01753 [Coccidioides immitis RMSCC 3703]